MENLAIEDRHRKVVNMRKGTLKVRDAYERYLGKVDEMSELMKERGLLRIPISVNSKVIADAEVTQDQRLVITERYGRFFKTSARREYHLKDLTEMLGMFGKDSKSLDGVSEEDIERVQSIIPCINSDNNLQNGYITNY